MEKSRKLPLAKREKAKDRSVSFTKRRSGLFNKAAELFLFCDSQLAIIVSSPCSKSPKRKYYSFGHPAVDAVMDAFLGNSVPNPVDDRSKHAALSLFNEIKGLEEEISHSTCLGRSRRPEHLSGFECFEQCESVDELQAVADGLDTLIAKAKSKINDQFTGAASNENDLVTWPGSNKNDRVAFAAAGDNGRITWAASDKNDQTTCAASNQHGNELEGGFDGSGTVNQPDYVSCYYSTERTVGNDVWVLQSDVKLCDNSGVIGDSDVAVVGGEASNSREAEHWTTAGDDYDSFRDFAVNSCFGDGSVSFEDLGS